MSLFQQLTRNIIKGYVLLFIITGVESKWYLTELDILPQLSSGAGELCRKQATQVLDHLDSLDTWAVQLYDATAKPSSGILNGNTVQFGDYEQCVSVRQERLGISGQYCLATMKVELQDGLSSPERDKLAAILELAHSHYAMQSSLKDGNFLPTFSLSMWGLCVPAACSHVEVEAAVNTSLQRFNDTLKVQVSVEENSCEVYRPKNIFKFKTFTTLSILLFIFAIAVFGTFYELLQLDSDGQIQDKQYSFIQKILLAFSFRKNVNELLDTSMPEDDISCLHGIRCFFSVLIYLLHRSIFGLFMPSANRTEMAKLLDSEWTMAFRAFWNHVDTFVLMSGLLTSYYATRTLQEGRKLNIPAMYLRRYIKFTPLLMVAVFLIRNVGEELRRGPQMIRVINHYLRNCDNIWKPLFYVSTFDGLKEMCYPPSHQLITDFQLYLTAPFLVLLLWRYRSQGVLSLTALLCVLTAYKAFTIYSNKLDTSIYYGISSYKMIRSGNLLYFNPIHRTTPYFLGIILGYYLQMTSFKSAQLSQAKLIAGWMLAGAAARYAFFGPHNAYSRHYQYDLFESTVYGILQPLTWSFTMAWVIFVCHTHQADLLNKALSWRGFVVFSRIAYAFYLIQIMIIAWNITSAHVPVHMHLFQVVDLNELAFLLGFSVLFTLLFFLPLKDLYQIFSGKESTKNPTKIEGTLHDPCLEKEVDETDTDKECSTTTLPSHQF